MNQKNPIQKLPNDLINQIAAGEVVERPASVVKELVENSIDAGAKNILVELKKGGKDLIKVVDDGVGLDHSEFGLVFERHATSKITSASDLEFNLSLGFRGEALAAISSVSQIEFASNGYAINLDGELKAKPMPPGTQVSVKNLFYNTPARLKFLKTDSTEYGKCLGLLEQYALCHPEIRFKLIHNDKTVFDYPVATERIVRVRQVLGEAFTEKLISINYNGSDLELEGLVGKPELAKERAYNQYFFVNGRPLESQYFAHAIRSAYGSLIFPTEKPPYLIWLNLKPNEVDMNVHPRKLEARFHFQGIIYNVLTGAIKQTLQKQSLSSTLSLSKPSLDSFISRPNNPSTESTFKPTACAGSQTKAPLYMEGFLPPERPTIPHYNDANPTSLEDVSPNPVFALSQEPLQFHPLAQLNNSYILCQNENGLVIIDQHAAHERVMYQKLKQARQQNSVKSQRLLMPVRITLSRIEVLTLKGAEQVLSNIGFDISPFADSDNEVVVNAVPDKFSQYQVEKVVHDLLSDLEKATDFDNLNDLEDIVINYAACRGAIKFGQPLNIQEMRALISEMEQIYDKQYSCPHGRPTIVEISFDDLEKQFKRK